MSRYDWPRVARGRRRGARRGRAAARRQWNLERSAGFDIETLIATPVRRTASAQIPPSEPGGAFAMAPPPAGGANPDLNLWLPVGPAGVLHGMADGDPRVAGRVRDIAISPDGQRAYAASALGGVWYSEDAGARWEPVGQWAMVPSAADVPASSNTLTCGAVHVRFDPGNDPALDEVWVGTGEPGKRLLVPTDFGFQGQYAGVGILHAVGPVDTSRNNPLQDPWTREALPRAAPVPAYDGLRGAAVFAFAADPANDRSLVAATSRGLHHNGSGLADPWTQRTLAAWSGLIITDVAWTPARAGVHPSLLWVAVTDTSTAAGNAVWVSSGGVNGVFLAVNLPGALGGLHARLALAADPAFPDVVYVLGTGPRLWRIDVVTPFPAAGVAPAVASAVANLPSELFEGQPQYDMAIAIDPGNVNRIIVGGASAFRTADSLNGSALYRLTVSAAPYQTDYAAADANAGDATWIGADVHADVHRVRWLEVGGEDHVWVCCDGGVFRSAAHGNPDSFVARATGLAVLEPGFHASHPVSDGLVLAGAQDNGALLRIGESVWRNAVNRGDGGGVAFDPGTTGRFAAQKTNSEWVHDADDGGPGITPSRRRSNVGGDGEHQVFDDEDKASEFYSNAAVVQREVVVNGQTVKTTQLAVGTHRIWYSEQWGLTTWIGTPPGYYQRAWTTLPSNTDPRAKNDVTPASAGLDVLAAGLDATGVSLTPTKGIRVLRWAGPDRIYAVTRGAIYQLDRSPPTTGAWTPNPPAAIFLRPARPAPLAWPVAGADLPDRGKFNDFAPHVPVADKHDSFYLATSHPLEPVWWFDGKDPGGQWYPARLGTTDPPAAGPLPAIVPVPPTGVRAPAYAVVVDPTDASIVYVGTTIGVWRGVLTIDAGNNPTWAWAPFNSGLPEAAVQDLAITTWTRPEGGGTVKILRAALQSRGIFEVELDVATTPATYLRVHPYDTRRIVPTDLRDPMWNADAPERDWTFDWADRRNRDYQTNAGKPKAAPDGTPVGSHLWHASPDIRLRPAPGGPAVPPPSDLPFTTLPTDRFWLWSVQTALRALAPAVAPGAHLIVPDGRWTNRWAAQLSAVRVALGDNVKPGARVTTALWNKAQVQAGFWTDPWADGGPTETDLVERIFGAATPRTGGVSKRATSPASLAVLPRSYRLHVCLHHRGREPLLAGEAAVVLFRFPLPATAATWAALPMVALPADAAGLGALRAALDAVGASGPLPAGFTLPAGWTTPDAAAAVRRPDAPALPAVTPVAATGAPAVITFNVDFTGVAAKSRFMFVALAHSTADPLALTGAGLLDTIRRSRHMAARSVVVI